MSLSKNIIFHNCCSTFEIVVIDHYLQSLVITFIKYFQFARKQTFCIKTRMINFLLSVAFKIDLIDRTLKLSMLFGLGL